jgi:hypothetical protein
MTRRPPHDGPPSAPRRSNPGLAWALLALTAAAAQAEGFAETVEHAHGRDRWYAQPAIETTLRVEFGGHQILEGRMLTDTPVGHTRFELADGSVLVWDGGAAWIAPADSSFQNTRFHVLTWPYFLAAPMKLRDPGSHLESLGRRPFRDGQSLETARMTFDPGVGDTPDDWYVLYRAENGRLAAMAYIVTFGKGVEAAEREPHAIVYDDWVEVEGVSISTRWTFFAWSEERGIYGDPIGHVALDDPRFVTPDAGAFDPPPGARAEPLP